MCTKVGIPIQGWLLTSSLVDVCNPEGATVLGVAAEWWHVGKEVPLPDLWTSRKDQ